MIADTSIAAAESIKPVAKTLRERVFDYIQSRGIHGATIDETVAALGLKIQTVCGRFNELAGGPYRVGDEVRHYPVRIVQTGETRQTESGRGAHCWMVIGATA